MSLALIMGEFGRFLSTPHPEIICIVGRWGVGKTFAWNRSLSDAQNSKRVALSRYSYISLFGRTSLADVRAAITESSVDSEIQGSLPDIKSFRSIYRHALGRTGWVAKWLPFIPVITNYSGMAERILFLSVRNQIVCIDDLERTGSTISLIEVLGLASDLKNAKKCKVVLLLNEDALSGDDAAVFREHVEKVCDKSLAFEPTPAEAAELALEPSNKFYDDLKSNLISLGVTNIRVIKRAEYFCSESLTHKSV